MDLNNFVLGDANPVTEKRVTRKRLQFPICAIVVQIALIVLLGIFVDYPEDANATSVRACDISRYLSKESNAIHTAFGLLSFVPYNEQRDNSCKYDESPINIFETGYQGTQFFIVSGISLLFVGIRHHSLSAMTITLFIISICLQWSFLCRGFLRLNSSLDPIKPSPDVFVITIFFAEEVLISWGVILGRTSQMQLFLMTMLEIPFATVNDYILLDVLKINDPSGAIIYNVFGTYYGLSVSRILYKAGQSKYEEKRATTVFSETLAFLGSNILWAFFPIAVGAIFVKDRRLRCIINTYFALTGSGVTGVVVGMLSDPKRRMTPGHVQNAIISSGVVMCAIADAMMGIYTAVIIGCISGAISVLTAVYFQPFLADKLHIVDTCASNALHGFPGILGGILSSIFAYLATEAEYGASLYEIYPARAPLPGTIELMSLQMLWPQVKAGEGRSASIQAAYQIACLGITIGFSICSGILTGVLMRLKIFDHLKEEDFYEDSVIWNMPIGEVGEIKGNKEDDRVIQQAALVKLEKFTQTQFDTNKIASTLTRL